MPPLPKTWKTLLLGWLGRVSMSLILIAVILFLYTEINPQGMLIVGGNPPILSFIYTNRHYPKNGIRLERVVFSADATSQSPEHEIWAIHWGSEDKDTQTVRQFEYGKVPSGWVEDAPAQPISLGDHYHILLKMGWWEQKLLVHCSKVVKAFNL